MSRLRERGLLVIALVVGTMGLGMVHIALYRHQPWGPVLLGAAALASFLLSHVLLAWRRNGADGLILPLVALLVGVGLTAIYRLDPERALRQAGWVAGGQAVLFFIVLAGGVGPGNGLARLASYKYLIGLLSLVLLGVAILFGVEVGGTRQWIRLGDWSFQPSEIVKVLLVIFFAGFLSDKQPFFAPGRRMLTVRYLGPMAALAGLALLLLVMQRDLGAGLLLFMVALLILYIAVGRARYVLMGIVTLVLVATVLGRVFPHVSVRLEAWRNPWADVRGMGYQTAQGLFALGSGGLTGTGLGLGHPELVPAAATDFTFTVIAEELGLLGGMAVVLAYLLLIARGIRLAVRAPSAFEALLAGGLSAVLGVQAFIILAGILRLIPLTGLTLPFVSYGGTSIVTSFAIAGLLLRIEPGWSGDAMVRAVRARARHVGLVLAGLLAALAVGLGWWQAVHGEALATHPDNPRLTLAEHAVLRGSIYDRRMRVLAESVAAPPGSEEPFIRRYPQGRLFAHVTGYSTMRYGKARLERIYNARLLGVHPRSFLDEARARLLGRPPRGQDLILTLDLDLQRATAEALGGRRGAIVVLDPNSGALLASVANPTYDPNGIAGRLPALRRDAASPLLDRATQGTYPPGSSFKVVTMAAGLRSGAVQMRSRFSCPGFIYIRKTKVTDFEERAHGQIDLRRALIRSCNVAFIKVGLETGAKSLYRTAQAVGIGAEPQFELPAAAGHLPSLAEMSGEGVGQAAFGQGSLAVSPLQMAMVAGMMANGGILYQPYIVAEIRDIQGRLVSVRRRAGKRVLEPEVTQHVADTMREVVRRGTGRAARIRGLEVAGKTGTAENPAGETHAWFIAFAPADDPRLAVAVVVEHGGIGGQVAAPIARQVLEAARPYLSEPAPALPARARKSRTGFLGKPRQEGGGTRFAPQ